jgi:hypothetical protein
MNEIDHLSLFSGFPQMSDVIQVGLGSKSQSIEKYRNQKCSSLVNRYTAYFLVWATKSSLITSIATLETSKSLFLLSYELSVQM